MQDPAEADVLVVNTCAFIESAREESVQAILEAARHKTHGTYKAARGRGLHGAALPRRAGAKSLPEVDAFVGLDELGEIVARAGIGAAAPPPTPAGVDLLPMLPAVVPSRYLYDEATPRRRSTAPWTAFVKIAEGCDHTCSFCAIPSFRGTFRSRRLGSLLEEAQALARSGVREISLIAQDSSHFGRDLGLEEGLAQLLAGLDEVEDLRWIRLHYLYPNTVTPKLIETMAARPRVVKYVDLPLQHAHAGHAASGCGGAGRRTRTWSCSAGSAARCRTRRSARR